MEDFIANSALLAAHLTRQCEQSVADQQAAIKDLRQTADSVGQTVASGQQALAQHAKGAIREALLQEIPAASQALGETAERVRRMAEQLQAEQAAMVRRAGLLGTKALACVAAGALLLVAGSGYVAWHNVKRAEQANVRAEVMQALQHVAITSCDGRPCLKLEDGLARWSKNDEYVLVDGGAGADNAQP